MNRKLIISSITLTLTLYVLFMAFESPLKFYLTPYIGSISKLMLLAITFFLIVLGFRNKRNIKILIVIVPLIFFSFLMYGVEPVFYTVYILIPFLSVLFIGNFLNFHLFDILPRRFLLFIFLMTVAGLVFDKLISFPWADGTYLIGGEEVAISRDWQQNGIVRLAGFSSISWNASSIIFFCLFFFYYDVELKRNKSVSFLLLAIAIGVVGNYFSTTKGVYLPLFYLILSTLIVKLNNTFKYILHSSMLFFILCVYMYSLFESYFVSIGVKTASYGSDIYSNLIFTLITRVYDTWADLIIQFSDCNVVFGCGISSVGASSFRYDYTFQNAADNILLYIISSFGVVGLFLFFFYIVSAIRTKKVEILVLLNSILLYGYFVNTFEFGVWGMILGFLLVGINNDKE